MVDVVSIIHKMKCCFTGRKLLAIGLTVANATWSKGSSVEIVCIWGMLCSTFFYALKCTIIRSWCCEISFGERVYYIFKSLISNDCITLGTVSLWHLPCVLVPSFFPLTVFKPCQSILLKYDHFLGILTRLPIMHLVNQALS